MDVISTEALKTLSDAGAVITIMFVGYLLFRSILAAFSRIYGQVAEAQEAATKGVIDIAQQTNTALSMFGKSVNETVAVMREGIEEMKRSTDNYIQQRHEIEELIDAHFTTSRAQHDERADRIIAAVNLAVQKRKTDELKSA